MKESVLLTLSVKERMMERIRVSVLVIASDRLLVHAVPIEGVQVPEEVNVQMSLLPATV